MARATRGNLSNEIRHGCASSANKNLHSLHIIFADIYCFVLTSECAKDIYSDGLNILCTWICHKMPNQLSFPRMFSLNSVLCCAVPCRSTYTAWISLLHVIWSCLQCFLHLNFKLKTKSDQEKTDAWCFRCFAIWLMHFIVFLLCVIAGYYCNTSTSITGVRMCITKNT